MASPKKKTSKKQAAADASKDAGAQEDHETKPSSSPTKKGSRSRPKALPRKFMLEVAQAIQEAATPAILAAKGREVVGQAPSGDVTFQLDKTAEKALLAFLRDAKMPVAYYSEDAGYTTFSSNSPENLLVVDPIDGSRAAKSGFEWCCVSVASTRVIERPTVGDLDNGVVLELLGDRAFYAERGKGARFYQNERNKKIKLSQVSDLEHMSWALSVPGRPAELVFNTAAKLIDHSSLRGGFFSCNSSAYGLTRLLTNQLDAYADIANRYYRDMPEIMRDKFINAGRGAVIGAAPYDLAAALLITKEAGCVVTDAFGKDFEDLLLLDSSESNFQSVVAAANPELHAKLMSYLDTRVGQLESVFRRRAEIMA